MTSSLSTGLNWETIAVIDPLQSTQWDDTLNELPNGSFYQSASWARVLHDSYGYRPYYLAISDQGRPRGVLPIMEVASKVTGRRGVTLPFTDDCDPAGWDHEALRTLFRHAQALGVQRRWRYLEIRGGIGDLPSAKPSLSYYGHRVPLSKDPDSIFKRFHPAVRRAVRKAERSDLSVEFSSSAIAMRDFYELSCQTRKRHGLPPQPFGFYEKIRQHVLAAHQGDIVLVRSQGRAVAGALFFYNNRTAVMKFAASDLRFQHLRINNLVMWTAMKRFGERSFEYLDFGRTSLFNAGLRTFKQRWGAVERKIDYFRYDLRLNEFTLCEDAASAWHLRIFRHLPVPISKIAGRILYRHMG